MSVESSAQPFSESPRGVFVTGTDTEVGKTVVSAALLRRLCGRYWKPVQTGPECDHDLPAVQRLTGLPGRHFAPSFVCYPDPLSPHEAAKRVGQRLDFAAIDFPAIDCPASHDLFWIVEGAGGALVPLDDDHVMTDLMQKLGLPVVVVARSTLGTINHSLLTLEALRTRGLTVAGVILNGPENTANKAAIEQFGQVAVLAELPLLDRITAPALETLMPRLDRAADALTGRA